MDAVRPTVAAPVQKDCRSCGQTIDVQDNFCRHCGTAQSALRAPWYYQHWGIIILILMIGPFALYNVIKSPVLSKKGKWIYTGAIILFTVYFVWSLYMFMARFTAVLNGFMDGNIEGLDKLF